MTDQKLGILDILRFKLREAFIKRQSQDAPVQLKGLTLIEKLTPFGLLGSYFMGMYKNESEERVFVKSWQGESKDLAYLTLVNEINCYRFFSNVNSERIKTPKLLKVIEDPKQLTVVYEYIDGASLEAGDPKSKLEAYSKTLDFLAKLSDIKETPLNFSSRTYLSYLITFPIVLLKSVFTYPTALTKIIKSGLSFLKLTRLSFFSKPLTLCHRDLNFRNILKIKEQLYLIDFQYTVLTLKEFEIASTIRSHIRDKSFMEELLKFTSKEGFNLILLKQMLIYYSLMGLCDKRFKKERTEDFFSCLNFAEKL